MHGGKLAAKYETIYDFHNGLEGSYVQRHNGTIPWKDSFDSYKRPKKYRVKIFTGSTSLGVFWKFACDFYQQ